jgi:glycine/D-amino acid oxidase-like deaminating enzyme
MDSLDAVRSYAPMPTDYRSLSLWMDQVGHIEPRNALPGDRTADIAIVGAGYTGLWTAYYLLKAQPDLRIVILERETAGFGASGRNGGWCSALFAAPLAKISKRYGRERAIALQREMFDTVDEVGRILEEEGIEARYQRSGTLTLVTSPTQLDRVKAELDEDRSWGFDESDLRWLAQDELEQRIRVPGVLGARFTPHCARVHPGLLVRGLAETVEGLGATIHERTTVTEIGDRQVRTSLGTVKADVIVRATEGYTAQLPGMKRKLLPLYSLMVATEPLPEAVWEQIGWNGCETLHDGRHLLIYAQRTADGRVAIGGRGAPYHFGSRIEDAFDHNPTVFALLRQQIVELFPAARDAKITHEWGGCLGVPRDWFSSVGYDRASGRAWAGGYVGDGVSTTNLAGRTLRDLILGLPSELIELPWVDHRWRNWEPEPLRWLGVNAGLKAMAQADRVEERTGRPSKRGELIKRLIGM